MRTAFPEKNIPSYKTIRKRHAIGKSLEKKCIRECSEGSLYTLNYVDEIENMTKGNIYSIVSYSKSCLNVKDIKLSATFNNKLQQMTVYLLLSSDGVKIVNSNKKSLWSVWLAIANLPPIKRCMFKKIVLDKLWFGKGKPY